MSESSSVSSSSSTTTPYAAVAPLVPPTDDELMAVASKHEDLQTIARAPIGEVLVKYLWLKRYLAYAINRAEGFARENVRLTDLLKKHEVRTLNVYEALNNPSVLFARNSFTDEEVNFISSLLLSLTVFTATM